MAWTLAILIILTATKNAYLASISSYFTFYSIHKFNVSVQDAQLLLFLFSGRPPWASSWVGDCDRFGSRTVIWFSILGSSPLR